MKGECVCREESMVSVRMMQLLCKPNNNRENVLCMKEEVRLRKNKKLLNANQSPPHSKAKQIQTWRNTWKKGPLLFFLFFLYASVPPGRRGEPTREGVRTAVLRLRRCHTGDDTLDTSRVFWVNRWMMRERGKMMTKLGKHERWGSAYETRAILDYIRYII